MERPEYIAKKSAWCLINFWSILFCVLIIPLFVLIIRIIVLKKYSIEFYQDRIVVKYGWLSKHESQSAFMGVYSVSVDQSLGGRICNYGNVRVDVPGNWDIDTRGISKPQELKAYLSTKTVRRQQTNNVLFNWLKM